MEATEYGYDTDMHRLPFYIAVFCSVCYLIAYAFTTFTAKFDNKLHFLNVQDPVWASAGLSSSFESEMQVWSILCIIRDILVILAWIVFCTQSNWNIGSAFMIKIESLNLQINNIRKEDEVYRHLFFGNPYLPFGIYHVHKAKEELKKSA